MRFHYLSIIVIFASCSAGNDNTADSSVPSDVRADSGTSSTPPADTGVATDSGTQTTENNPPTDTGVAADTATTTTQTTDTGMDTSVADTLKADTTVADTTVADTTKADTTVADTAVADTTKADTAVADTSVPDTSVADTSVNCSGPTLTGGSQTCSSSQTGTLSDGMGWSIWSSGSGGCITPFDVGSAFKANWNNSGDFLARVGFQWDATKTYDKYGTLSADYAYTKTGNAGGYSFIGIYGWSENPLHEFYIVDDTFNASMPNVNSLGSGAQQTGTLDVDGATYNLYTHTQTNQPSITGTATFVQFFSIRQTARQCGHISISSHFAKWASLGMTLGNMYEAKLLVEAGGGTGSINYTLGTMTAQ